MAENDENRYISISQMVAKENIETEKYRVMPRQEAIECMAKALCKYDVGGAVGCKCCKFAEDKEKCEAWIALNHNKNAEIALDALLSLQG